MPNVFSIDLEDWFHLLDNSSAPEYDRWTSLESRVRQNTETLLAELATRRVRCTFFVLGWIAEQYPELVADVARAGHEIASHGYSHTLIYAQTPYEFQEDLRRLKGRNRHASQGDDRDIDTLLPDLRLARADLRKRE